MEGSRRRNPEPLYNIQEAYQYTKPNNNQSNPPNQPHITTKAPPTNYPDIQPQIPRIHTSIPPTNSTPYPPNTPPPPHLHRTPSPSTTISTPSQTPGNLGYINKYQHPHPHPLPTQQTILHSPISFLKHTSSYLRKQHELRG